ncbi:unnamed protein product [Rotaria sp. Silwood2]|nr:unnamed protein product [Rotaria sp. Silwood2]CAF3894587.1 unnamed protein product [Rotaria sp. Silwood2]
MDSRLHCVECRKQRATSKCAGCLQDLCYNHLTDHCEQLSKELDEIEINRNLFRQTLTEQTNHPKNDSLMEEINKWKEDSIIKIQQIAEECKQLLIQYTNKYFNQLEIDLVKLTDQLRQTRQENDFNEIDLNQLKEKLTQLKKDLDQPPKVSITQDSTCFIKKISIIRSSRKCISYI